jgi:hypothetical protein
VSTDEALRRDVMANWNDDDRPPCPDCGSRLAYSHSEGCPRAFAADPPRVPFGSTTAQTATLTEAEHVLRGMWALYPDYFTALLAEVRLGRPLDLSAVAKARKALQDGAR